MFSGEIFRLLRISLEYLSVSHDCLVVYIIQTWKIKMAF